MAKAKKEEKISVQEAIKKIQHVYGEDCIVNWNTVNKNVDVISTGCLSLDRVTGIGGIPKGRIVEIYGPESSGKTTVALHCASTVQKEGGTVAYIDVEHAIDANYMEALGITVEDVILSQPSSGENAINIIKALIDMKVTDLIVLDSVAALVPLAEKEGDSGDRHVASSARLMSQALRMLVGGVKQSNTCLLFINQLRQNINTGPYAGSGEVTTGGKALKYYASLRLDIRRIKTEADSGFNRTKITVKKNKLAPPFGVCEFDIVYGKGISKTGDILDLAENYGLIERKGAWYSFDGASLGQGRANVIQSLEDNVESLEGLRNLVKTKMDLEMGINSDNEGEDSYDKKALD